MQNNGEIIDDVLCAYGKIMTSGKGRKFTKFFTEKEYELLKENCPDELTELESKENVVVLQSYVMNAVMAGETTALSVEYEEPKQYLPDIPCKTKRKATKKKYRFKKRKKK